LTPLKAHSRSHPYLRTAGNHYSGSKRPADYLRIVALIVSKCDINLDDEMRDAAVEQFIEERRQAALLTIAKMDEPDDA
jgi:hypothetical protein